MNAQVQFQVKTNKEEYLERCQKSNKTLMAFEKHLYTVSGSLQYPKSGTSNIKLTDTGSILNPTGSGVTNWYNTICKFIN